MEGAPTTVVVADTSVLINLILVQRLDLLGALERFRFVVPDQVVEEVTRPEEARELAAALHVGYLYQESSTDLIELALYAELRQTLGRGEAAALAMAQARGCMVACDERGAFLRQTGRRLGEDRLTNTPGLMLLAIRTGKLSVTEADQLKKVLEGKRFKMRFESFRDLIG